MNEKSQHPSFDLLESDEPHLNALPRIFSDPIKLLHREKMNHAEIAKQMNWPVGTVKSRIFRGRELIRRKRVEAGVKAKAGAGMHRTVRARVLRALRSGQCSTSQDVADLIDLPISADKVSQAIANLERAGHVTIRRTGERIPNLYGRGSPLHVFEVVA